MSRARRRREGGYGLLWVVILIALVVLGGLVLHALHSDTEEAQTGWILGFSLLAAGGLVIEARRDAYEFCQAVGVLTLIGVVVCGLVIVLAEAKSPALVATTACLAIASLVCFVTQYRMSHAEELLPNALAELLPESTLRELSGLQFGVTHSDLRVPAGGELVVSLHAQNGMDAERTLELRLKLADIGRGGHLAFAKVASLDLPPGAAGTVSLPVAVHPKARGTYRITVEPKVKGSGGRRLRVFRARPFTQKVSPAFQLLAFFGGVFVWGGGITLKLQVAKNRDWKNMPVEEAPLPEARLFYQPDRALLEGIRTRL